MVWYSPEAGLKPATPAGAQEPHPGVSTYDWALGRRPAGEPKETSHVQVEPARAAPDLREMARLIRGDER